VDESWQGGYERSLNWAFRHRPLVMVVLLATEAAKDGAITRSSKLLGPASRCFTGCASSWWKRGLEAVLSRKQRAMPAVPKIFDGEKEAKLIALACSKPPEGRVRWTLRLLEEKVVELKIVDKASDNTIGRVLKKTFSNPTSRSNGLFRPRRTAHS
jgi:hypothetical protein